MSFDTGFEKIAVVGALASLAGRGLAAVGGRIGRGLVGAGKALGRGALRVGSGNLTRPLSTTDKLLGAAGMLGSVSEGGEHYDKLRRASVR